MQNISHIDTPGPPCHIFYSSHATFLT